MSLHVLAYNMKRAITLRQPMPAGAVLPTINEYQSFRTASTQTCRLEEYLAMMVFRSDPTGALQRTPITDAKLVTGTFRWG
jgi:hypothetical protein